MLYRVNISIVLLIFLFQASALLGQNDEVPRSVLQQAASQFQEGEASKAEEILRAAIQHAPRDPVALGLLGAILDSQKRYTDAESAYQQALALAPGSPGLLNNLGNHYMAQGKSEQARAAYLKVLATQLHHVNANLQLALLSVSAKQGVAALKYLDHLPAENRGLHSVAILRARALRLAGQEKGAQSLLSEAENKYGNDPHMTFSIGMTYVEWKKYPEAENAFARALDADPTNFDILYNLGLAAQHAGHLGRALEVYKVALQQRPDDPDCLFNLASIYTQTNHPDEAIVPLMHAHKVAPERADILIALAQSSQDTGFYADATTAIDEYLKLKPEDDVARRERGFCLVRSAKLDEGLKDLRWYAQKHPEDARGFYELAIAETVHDRDMALQHLTRALVLDAKLNAARYARGVLYYQMGMTEESIADLKLVLAAQPEDSGALDALGEDYSRLGKYGEAQEAFEHALKLAPKNPKILNHYAHVLIRLNRKEEAEKVIAQFQALGPEEGRRRPYGGLFDFLNLPPEQQYAKYMENLQRTIQIRPDDPNLRVQFGKAMLREGKMDEAVEAFRTVRRLTSNPDLLAACGNALVESEQYGPAREFLEPLVAANPAAADLRINLAIAIFHIANAGEALKVLQEIPTKQRNGDYFLLLAQILDAMQKPEEAAQALNLGLNAAPTRADLYLEAALFLIKHKQYRRAINLLDQANHSVPDSPALELVEAMTYEMLQQNDDSMRILDQLESRWPEWSLPYEIHGISLETRLRSKDARQLLETAISLGAHDSNVYYYLASAISHSTQEDVDAAQKAIEKALELNPNDAYVQSLAGRIAYQRKEYPTAIEHLQAALRLWPDMVEAHQSLAGVYRAMGEKEKSVAELKDILRIKQENPTADQTPPFPVSDLLFGVGSSSPQPVEIRRSANP
jgi:tetratricopeptide (TPR) repeat protein